MTLTLGWKSLTVAIVVALLAAVAVAWSVHRAQVNAADFAKIDAERRIKIEELEEALQEKTEKAQKAFEIANQAKQEADEAKVGADQVKTRLTRARAALRKARAESEEQGEPELPPVEEVKFLRDQNELLETALSFREEEADSLREALDLTKVTLAHRTEQFDIMGQRYKALEKRVKQNRRRKIIDSILIGIGGGATGFAIGFVSSR